MPLKEAQWFYGAENRLTAIAMIVEEADLTIETVASLQSELDSTSFAVLGWRELMPELIQQIEMDYVGGLIMSYILYVVIAFGIFGTFLMMVNERKYEFGIIMAVGMKRFRLQLVIFLESIMITISGTLAGILISLPIILYFYQNPIRFGGEYEAVFEAYGMEPIMPFSIDPGVFTSQAYAVLIITLILSIYPIWAIYKLKINQAIRA